MRRMGGGRGCGGGIVAFFFALVPFLRVLVSTF